jgi:glycosyltransferase involved in cell wall biosynthesis
MPILNAQPFLREAVESVLAQSFMGWELLLVDDGSTDGSAAIAQAYARQFPEKIRYLEHPGHENRGASATRNLGIRHAQGEFLALLDADDVWLPHKLEQQVALLDAHPEAGILYGKTLFWRSWTGQAADRERDYMPFLGVPVNTILPPPELLIRCLLGTAASPGTCSILVRRELVERVGGFEEQFRRIHTDGAFYTKIFCTAPVYVANYCWDKYRLHPNSCTSTVARSGKDRAELGAYLAWTAAYIEKHGLETPELQRALRIAQWLQRNPAFGQTIRWTRRSFRRLLAAALRLWISSVPRREGEHP